MRTHLKAGIAAIIAVTSLTPVLAAQGMGQSRERTVLQTQVGAVTHDSRAPHCLQNRASRSFTV